MSTIRRYFTNGKVWKQQPAPQNNTATKVTLRVLGAGVTFGLGLYAPEITRVIHSYTGKPEPALSPPNPGTDQKKEVVIPTTVSTHPGATPVPPLANPPPKSSTDDWTRTTAITTVAGAAFLLGVPIHTIGLGALLALPFTKQKEPPKESKP